MAAAFAGSFARRRRDCVGHEGDLQHLRCAHEALGKLRGQKCSATSDGTARVQQQ